MVSGELIHLSISGHIEIGDRHVRMGVIFSRVCFLIWHQRTLLGCRSQALLILLRSRWLLDTYPWIAIFLLIIWPSWYAIYAPHFPPFRRHRWLEWWSRQRRLLFSFHLKNCDDRLIAIKLWLFCFLALLLEVVFGCRHFLLVVDQALVVRIFSINTPRIPRLLRQAGRFVFRPQNIILLEVNLLSIALSLTVLHLDGLAGWWLLLYLVYGLLLIIQDPTYDEPEKTDYKCQNDWIYDVNPFDFLLWLSNPIDNYSDIGVFVSFCALRDNHNVWHLNRLTANLNFYC